MFVDRIFLVGIMVTLLISSGCKPEDTSSDDNSTTAGVAPQAAETDALAAHERHASPDEAVSSFLIALKSGDDSRATSLLTTKAQTAMQRTDAAIKPPGSPTAEFNVTEVEYLGEQKTGAHVLSSWTDTDDDGVQQTYEIVWILRRESAGWAIAGMATQVFEDRDPLVLNFEDPLDAQRKRVAVDQEIARRNSDSPQQVQQANREPDGLRR